MSIASADPYEPISEGQWTQLRAAWPYAARLETAWRLALDVETLGALLAGESVNPDRIDPEGLAWANAPFYFQLVRPIDGLADGDEISKLAVGPGRARPRDGARRSGGGGPGPLPRHYSEATA